MQVISGYRALDMLNEGRERLFTSPKDLDWLVILAVKLREFSSHL